MQKKYYKTIVISDVHLGIKSSKAKQVIKFLKNHSCDTLILNGDIVDGWELRRFGQWEKVHTKFFKYIMKLVAKNKTRIIYVRGNHDDFLDQLLPFKMRNFSLVRDFVLESNGKRYYVVHGDIFDSVTTKMRWLANLGSIGYSVLLWINRHYNNYREKRNLPYYSLSQKIKLKLKAAVSFIDDFEAHLCKAARAKKCEGIITGHIHKPDNKYIDGIHYLNSGDWVETMSALCETAEGDWRVIYYETWKQEMETQQAAGTMAGERAAIFISENLSIQPI